LSPEYAGQLCVFSLAARRATARTKGVIFMAAIIDPKDPIHVQFSIFIRSISDEN
jgi:hypothetical protein